MTPIRGHGRRIGDLTIQVQEFFRFDPTAAASSPLMNDPIPPEELVLHAGFLRSLARSLLRSSADADDASQEALARGLVRGPEVPAARRAWLATVVRNAAAGIRRRAARGARREERVARPDATPSASDLATRAETIRLVARAVAALDPADRDVVVLRHYEGLPPREIAARLDTSVAAVKSRLQRAHARLRTRLGSREEDRCRALAALAAFSGAAVPIGAGAVVATAVGVLLVLGAVAWVALREPDDVGSGGHASTPGKPREIVAPDQHVPSLVGRAPDERASPDDERPPPDTAVKTPPGWILETVVDVQLSVPPTWTVRRRDLAASWEVGGSGRDSKGFFFLIRDETPERAWGDYVVESEGWRVVGGRRARWQRGRRERDGETDERWMLVLEDPSVAIVSPVFLAATRGVGGLDALLPVLERVLETVRFAGPWGVAPR